MSLVLIQPTKCEGLQFSKADWDYRVQNTWAQANKKKVIHSRIMFTADQSICMNGEILTNLWVEIRAHDQNIVWDLEGEVESITAHNYGLRQKIH